MKPQTTPSRRVETSQDESSRRRISQVTLRRATHRRTRGGYPCLQARRYSWTAVQGYKRNKRHRDTSNKRYLDESNSKSLESQRRRQPSIAEDESRPSQLDIMELQRNAVEPKLLTNHDRRLDEDAAGNPKEYSVYWTCRPGTMGTKHPCMHA